MTPATVLGGSEAGGSRRSGLMSLREYVHHTGLSTDALLQLEDMGLVGARAADAPGLRAAAEGAAKERETGGRPIIGLYDSLDLRAGWALKTLLDSGLCPEDLEMCGQRLVSAAEDVALVHYKLLRTGLGSTSRVSSEILKAALSELLAALTLRALRRIAVGAKGLDHVDSASSRSDPWRPA